MEKKLKGKNYIAMFKTKEKGYVVEFKRVPDNETFTIWALNKKEAIAKVKEVFTDFKKVKITNVKIKKVL